MRQTGRYHNTGEMAPNWNAITEATARQLKGEPNARLSNRRELRWGSHGSFKLTIEGQDIGSWYDWEAREGGRGPIRLAEYLLSIDRDGALNWLRQKGYLSGPPSDFVPAAAPASIADEVPAKTPTSDRSALAQSIWISSDIIPRDSSHPARRWFSNRQLWRQELPTPPMLRWRRADGAHTGAGSIVAMLAPPEAWAARWPCLPVPTGVQIISIEEQGRPALDRPADKGGLNKRTLGVANNAVFVIGNPVLSEASTQVRIAEGLADSLALAARYDGPVVAMIGTSGMRNLGFAAWLATTAAGVIIHADSDEARKGRAPAGTTAAGVLRRAIIDAGGRASAVYPPDGYKDAAEAAQAAGFSILEEDWIEFARTLAETTNWPRWEIARIAQIATSGA
jgi:hypothetical protein